MRILHSHRPNLHHLIACILILHIHFAKAPNPKGPHKEPEPMPQCSLSYGSPQPRDCVQQWRRLGRNTADRSFWNADEKLHLFTVDGIIPDKEYLRAMRILPQTMLDNGIMNMPKISFIGSSLSSFILPFLLSSLSTHFHVSKHPAMDGGTLRQTG